MELEEFLVFLKRFRNLKAAQKINLINKAMAVDEELLFYFQEVASSVILRDYDDTILIDKED